MKANGIETTSPGAPHDHARCVDTALETADALCRENGTRLTDTRRRVLELIWESHRPVKAYDLLDRLTEEGRPVKPPTVYRALDFLLENRLIHRIEGLNAVVGCTDPAGDHPGYFLVCDSCEAVTELTSEALDRLIDTEAGEAGFTVYRQSVEIFGRCGGCQARESAK